MTKPPLPWPRLTETLDGPKNPELCQSCGGRGKLYLWMEHDDQDKPEAKYVILCVTCSDKIIEPHPRLYARMPQNMPAPGFMAVCVECIFRDGLQCTHQMLKSNGGPGLPLKFEPPTICMVDGVRGGKRTGWTEKIYSGPVECPCRQTEESGQ